VHAVRSGTADLATNSAAAEILARPGWARVDETPGLTSDGEIALSLAGQYRYPMTYLPLLRQVPDLLFGDPANPARPADPARPAAATATTARKPTWTGSST